MGMTALPLRSFSFGYDDDEHRESENSEEVHITGQALGEDVGEWLDEDQINKVKEELEKYGPLLKFITMPHRDDGKPGKILAVFKEREDALKFTNEMNKAESAEADAIRGTFDFIEDKTLHFFRKPSRFSKLGRVNTKAIMIRNLNY